MSETPSSAALRLTCQPSKSGNTLVFPYRLDNEGPGNVYAMQAVAAFGSASEDTAAIVIEAETGDVIVGTFMPPLPIDRRIAVPLPFRWSAMCRAADFWRGGSRCRCRSPKPAPISPT